MSALVPFAVPSLPPWAQPFNTFAIDGNGGGVVAGQTPVSWEGRPIGLSQDLAALPIAWLPENVGASIGFDAKRMQGSRLLWRPTQLASLRSPGIVLAASPGSDPTSPDYALAMVAADPTLAAAMLARGLNMVQTPAGHLGGPAAAYLPSVATTVVRDVTPKGRTTSNLVAVCEPQKWAAGDILQAFFMGTVGASLPLGDAATAGPTGYYTTDPINPGPPTDPGGYFVSNNALSLPTPNFLAASLQTLRGCVGVANRWRKVIFAAPIPNADGPRNMAILQQVVNQINAVVPCVLYPLAFTDGAAQAYPYLKAEIKAFFNLN